MVEAMNIFSLVSSTIPVSNNALNCIKVSMMTCIDASQGTQFSSSSPHASHWGC